MRFISGAAFALSVLCSAALGRDLPQGQSQACGLISDSEARALLGARVSSIDADAPPGTQYCAWAVDRGTLQNQLTITLLDGPMLGGYPASGYYQAARTLEASGGAADLAGIGQAAFIFTDDEGGWQAVVLHGDWVALVRGNGLSAATVTEAARIAAARLPAVQHWKEEPLPGSCALLSLAEAAAALRHFPYVTVGDTPEGRASCTWSYGGTAYLSLSTREGDALGGQSASQYFKNAMLNEEVSRAVDMIDAGERAFISPANPRDKYFFLMVLQNARIALISGIRIDKKDAVAAAAAIAGRM